MGFKRDQYQFEGADIRKKSVLLKDILAMANSWRAETAFILIGVEEAAPAKVVGLTDHTDPCSQLRRQ